MKECKIVQDLLPNYIERLTNEETNKYIEEHIKDCLECKEILENMQKKLNVKTEEKDEKTVKILKKYNSKMLLFKIVFILFLIIIALFGANVIRKYTILKQIANKADGTININNYHKRVYWYDKENTSIIDYYGLNEKRKMVRKEISVKGTKIVSTYGTKISEDEMGNKQYNCNVYTIDGENKTVIQNAKIWMGVDPQNPIEMSKDSTLSLLFMASRVSIKNDTYNGEKCFFISTNSSDVAFNFLSNAEFISKNTGLTINSMSYEVEVEGGENTRWPASDYEYEFNNVSEDEFIEPDINEYKQN